MFLIKWVLHILIIIVKYSMYTVQKQKTKSQINVSFVFLISKMASALLVTSGRKRKRNISATSSSGSNYHDPEISFNFFATPTKSKKPRLQIDEPLPDLPVCQLIDEDISFRISDPIENAIPSQIVDDDVSFLISQTEPDDPEPRRSPNGYILPDPLPSGLLITDLRKG